MPSQATPVSARERILTLDVIRGFALLGIFIMNMPYFNTSFFAGADGTHLWPAWWDRTAETARDVLFSGKFNSMFSMLFAIGFTIQLGRLEQRDPSNAKAIYLRRIFWLLVFGIVHATVFWTGDVLHIYALFGVALLILRRAPDKLLWALFVACLVYPAVVGAYRLATTTPEEVQQFVATAQAWETSNNAAYGGGSFVAAVREHTREMIFVYTDPRAFLGILGFYVQIFSTMVIGLMLGRRNFFQNSGAYLPLVKRVQWWALGVGALTGAIFGYYLATVENPATPTPFGVLVGVAYYICRVCIMAFYVATLIRAVHNDVWRRRLAPMATAGRMPLTNYLLQTLMATFIFYGWGLGLWGEVGPAWDLALAVGIFFLIQVPLSRLWLQRFAMGPMEYLWRVLTYGRAPLRRAYRLESAGQEHAGT
jgi:uncharacterized protein